MKLKNNISESKIVKNEKRSRVLRERETSGQSLGQTMEVKRQSLPGTLIYISCGWDSFKEDCVSLLSTKAWHLEKAHGFNYFPGTQSIETLAVFKRGLGENVNRKKTSEKKRNA